VANTTLLSFVYHPAQFEEHCVLQSPVQMNIGLIQQDRGWLAKAMNPNRYKNC